MWLSVDVAGVNVVGVDMAGVNVLCSGQMLQPGFPNLSGVCRRGGRGT
jgi:hypothetical protein